MTVDRDALRDQYVERLSDRRPDWPTDLVGNTLNAMAAACPRSIVIGHDPSDHTGCPRCGGLGWRLGLDGESQFTCDGLGAPVYWEDA